MFQKKTYEGFLSSLIGRSPATKKLYRIVLAHLFEHIKKTPESLTIQDIRDHCQHLETQHNYSINSLRAHVNIIRSFLKYIGCEELHAQIKPVRPPKTLPHVPSAEDIQAMIEVTSSLRNRMIIRTLARTGLRLGELCALNRQDIDLENRRILVRGIGAKGGKERVVRMDSETTQLI
jgi:integrase/recombinase XerD